MLDNDVSALVVVDECPNACGSVSKTDLIGLYGKDLSLITAEDIMSPRILAVSLNTLVYEAVQLMLEHKIRQLVIVTQAGAHHRPVAIFTNGDAVALMAGESEPRSEIQKRCAECLRKLLSIALANEIR
jgi:CBS domain-containing protein